MMEFEIDQTRFLSALALAQAVADKRSTMPVLANALLRATSDGQLVCSTTDMIISLVERVTAEVHGTGGVTLGVRHLHDIVRTLPEGTLKIKSLENHWAQIVAGGTEFKLMGMPESDFPELPEPKTLEFTAVPGHALADLLQKTQFSISTDEARVNLNGALLECDGRNATMVSTDGHRLTKYVRDFPGPTLPKGIILPRKGVLELRRVLDRAAGDVGLAVGEQHLFVQVDELTLSVKLTSVTFPPYDQVIPSTHERHIIVAREELLSAFRRAEVMAPEKTATIRVQLGPDKLEITADNPNLGVARQEIAVEYQHDPLAVGFNARYLIDVLEAMEADEVRLEFQGELDPVVLKPEQDIDYLGVVMPMRI
jgi:DNA polymerase-3 subunit beta